MHMKIGQHQRTALDLLASGPQTAAEIAEEMEKTTSKAEAILSALVARGLVCRGTDEVYRLSVSGKASR